MGILFRARVSEISTAEVYESRHVISASDNTILLGESKINPYQEKWGRRSLDSEAFLQANQAE